jgi:hypothetical protein
MGEPVALEVKQTLKHAQFPEAVKHMQKIFGSIEYRDFLGWLHNTILWSEPAIRSEAFGPSAADTKKNLKHLAVEWRATSDDLCEIGSREFSLMARAAKNQGRTFETYGVVQELRHLAEAAEAAASSIRVRTAGRRKKRVPSLLSLAREIAAKLSQAGIKPTMTEGGAYVEILRVAADSLDSSWPSKRPLKISAVELAREALSGK